MAQFAFHVPGKLPGRNEQERAARAGWPAANRLKRVWTARVAAAVIRAAPTGAVPQMRRPVAINIAVVERNRRRDPDNIIGGAVKYLLDGMVASGLLAGDGWRYVAALSATWTVGPAPGCTITITEVDNGGETHDDNDRRP